jgi:hypothetical protein
MLMAFERFTKTGGRGYIPKVSIWGKGQIGFNQGAVNKFNLNNFEYAVLFYDSENKKIGMKFTNDKENGIVKLVKRAGSGISMSAKAFLDFYGIDYSEKKRYTLSYDKENDLYILINA